MNQFFSFLFFFFKDLFIYFTLCFGCDGSLLLHVDFLQLWEWGIYSAVVDHSFWWLLWRLSTSLWNSVVALHVLSSCGTGAYLLCGVWNLSGSRMELVTLALQRGFFATGPAGKPRKPLLTWLISHNTSIHCTNLFFICIFTFPEIVKNNMLKTLHFLPSSVLK